MTAKRSIMGGAVVTTLFSALLFVLVAMLNLPAIVLAATSATDDSGNVIVLDEPARRIVSLAPHATEMLFAAGAGQFVVGAADYSDYPPAAKSIPRLGGYDNLDLERIVALEPDLVVGWQSGNSPQQIKRLKTLGLVVYETEPREIEAIAGHIERLGELAGTQTIARQSAMHFRTRLEALRQRYSKQRKINVFYQMWNQPLMTVNGEHVISKVINLCGGVNVFAGLPLLAANIDIETVLAANPEVIVASGMAKSRPHWLDSWRRWPELEAVRRANLYFVPPDIIQRHSPRILQGAEQLCIALNRARNKSADP